MENLKKKLNANLILLLLGRMISDIGSSIQMLILPLYIIDIGGSAATVGISSFLSLMPIMLVYPFAGVMGDRLNRKTIMIASDSMSAVLVLLLAYVSFMGNMNLVLLLTIQAFVSLFYGFFDPATKGMIPQLVEEKDLNKTNSKVATLRILSGLIAPLVSVALYTSYGITLLFLINGLSFLFSACSEMLIKYEHITKESVQGIKGIFHDMKEGALFIKESMLIRKMSVFFFMIFALIQPIFAVILPLFFRTKLAYSDTEYGYLQMTLFSGAFIGSVVVGLISKEGKIKKPLLAGIGVMSIAILGFSIMMFPKIVSYIGNDTTSYLIGFAFWMFLLYTSIMFVNIPAQTIIQKQTPSDYMSRVFSIVGMIMKGGMPLGALIYGFVLDIVPIHITALAAGGIILILSTRFIVTMKKIEQF